MMSGKMSGLSTRPKVEPVWVETEEQEAAFERAWAGLEAQADAWAEEIRLVDWVKNIVNTGRLNRSAPDDVREKFIARQESLIDGFVRQTYSEGFLRGGESRKEYDDKQIATLQSELTRAREREKEALWIVGQLLAGIDNKSLSIEYGDEVWSNIICRARAFAGGAR